MGQQVEEELSVIAKEVTEEKVRKPSQTSLSDPRVGAEACEQECCGKALKLHHAWTSIYSNDRAWHPTWEND